ncbi:hypothetical protein [Actinomyces bowdenii]|uniref:Uncharacterized protein n=1 Tax=Actinomyces bowdenii TaxID=131109 RepID=A0A853EJP7_9ACTO|nr:hypothetical protein [Actinomyces bowdenii]MBF0697211.1 hypothetical protein [Actinomyces bowdenii]NYS69384.1 hypothetical protein [Actinomyces bowdenii]
MSHPVGPTATGAPVRWAGAALAAQRRMGREPARPTAERASTRRPGGAPGGARGAVVGAAR